MCTVAFVSIHLDMQGVSRGSGFTLRSLFVHWVERGGTDCGGYGWGRGCLGLG